MTRGNKKSYPKGGYFALPHIVTDNPDYYNLSGSATKLLNALGRQYRGSNNGDLTTAYSILKNQGFKSKDTIKRACDELLKANLIVKTREGKFTNPGGTCSLYAITWLPIDECGGKLEVNSTITPPRKFSLENNKTPRPETGHGSSLKSGRQHKRNSKGQYSSALKSGRLTVVT